MKEIIPEDIALEICELIRECQCWGCMKYLNKKGNVKLRCLFSSENNDNRGCQLVNKIFDNEYQMMK